MNIKNIIGLLCLLSSSISFGQLQYQQAIPVPPAGTFDLPPFPITTDGTYAYLNACSLGPTQRCNLIFTDNTGALNIQNPSNGLATVYLGNLGPRIYTSLDGGMHFDSTDGSISFSAATQFGVISPNTFFEIKGTGIGFGINSIGTPTDFQLSNTNFQNLQMPEYTVPYFDIASRMKPAVLNDSQALVGNTGNAPTPQTILTPIDLLPITQAIGFPAADTIVDGPYVNFNTNGDTSLITGRMQTYWDSTNTYSTDVRQGLNGLRFVPNMEGKGIQLDDSTITSSVFINQNISSFDIQTTSPDITISSTDPSALTTIGTDITLNKLTANQVIFTDSSNIVKSLPLTSGQIITANSEGEPIAGNLVAGDNITLINDGSGNTTIAATGGGGSTVVTATYPLISTSVTGGYNISCSDGQCGSYSDNASIVEVACAFNAGDPSGTTSYTRNIVLAKNGSTVTVQLNQIGGTTGTSARQIRTDISASPGCIPAEYRPLNGAYSTAITQSNLTPSTGWIYITPDGNIAISYSIASPSFPANLPGGLGFGNGDVVVQTVTYSLPYFTVTGEGTGGTVTPTPQTWIEGTSTSLIFDLTADVGYELGTVSDDCDSGFPGGSLFGSSYIVTTVNDNCVVTATFNSDPIYVVTGDGTGGISSGTVLPSPQNFILGLTPYLDFTLTRSGGSQFESAVDDCDEGYPGGGITTWPNYRATTVNQDCTVSAYFIPTTLTAYFDFTAVGSIAVIPDAAYLVPNFIIHGFSDISSPTLPTAQLNAIVYAIEHENIYTNNALGLGGAGLSYSTFASIGASTVVSNLVSQINQINALLTTGGAPVEYIDLDLEGSGWTSAVITDLANRIHGSSLSLGVTAAPQAYTSGGDVDPINPTNLIMTSGGGMGNNYGPALEDGLINYLNVQSYNTGGWTIGGTDEGNAAFFSKLAQALNTIVKEDCTGVATLCIKEFTNIGIGSVANAGAGGDGPGALTLFNPTGGQIYPSPPNSIPAYNQSTILSDYQSYIVTALNNYPYVNGIMMWSLNNDWAPLLYNSSDTYATAGAFTSTIFNSDL